MAVDSIAFPAVLDVGFSPLMTECFSRSSSLAV